MELFLSLASLFVLVFGYVFYQNFIEPYLWFGNSEKYTTLNDHMRSQFSNKEISELELGAARDYTNNKSDTDTENKYHRFDPKDDFEDLLHFVADIVIQNDESGRLEGDHLVSPDFVTVIDLLCKLKNGEHVSDHLVNDLLKISKKHTKIHPKYDMEIIKKDEEPNLHKEKLLSKV